MSYIHSYRYIGISIIFHIALIALISSIGVPIKYKPPTNFFEVEIVNGYPYGYSSTDGGGEDLQIANKEAEQTLQEVAKEEITYAINPDLAQSDPTPPEDFSGNDRSDNEPSTSSSRNQSPGEGEGGMSWGGGVGPSSYVLDVWRSRATSNAKRNPWSRQSSYLNILWESQLMSLVKRIWRETSENQFTDTTLKVTYCIRLSPKGNLLGTSLLMPSGNDRYDRSVQLALKKITNVPPPPLPLASGQGNTEVIMSFPISNLALR